MGRAARGAVAVALLAGLAMAPGAVAQEGQGCGRPGWVGAWGTAMAAPSTVPGFAEPAPRVFVDETLRMVVTPTVSGSAVRLRLSNRFGEQPVRLDGVHVGLKAQGASVVPGTNRPVTVGGRREVVLPPGAVAVTDPVPLRVTAFAQLAVSMHVPAAAVLDQHPEAWQVSFTTLPGAGSAGADETGKPFSRQVRAWYVLDAVDVLAPRQSSAVVALGDSITDGSQSTYDADRRYPDALARRLATDGSTDLAVLNAGIGANQVSRSTLPFGPSGAARVAPDVLSRTGARALLLLEGINDIALFGDPTEPPEQAAERVLSGYRSIIGQARAAGLLVVGGTLTPAGRQGGVDDARQRINTWIRTSGAFDAVVDFDAALRDPQVPWRMQARFDSGDGLHPNDTGYAAMADAVDVSVLQRLSCGGQP